MLHVVISLLRDKSGRGTQRRWFMAAELTTSGPGWASHTHALHPGHKATDVGKTDKCANHTGMPDVVSRKWKLGGFCLSRLVKPQQNGLILIGNNPFLASRNPLLTSSCQLVRQAEQFSDGQ